VNPAFRNFSVKAKVTDSELLSICFVSQEYPEETGWGGIGTYTFEMAHGLARAGHRVIVISRAVDQPRNYVEADGVEVYRVLPSLNLDSTPILWRVNRFWEGYRLAVALQLKRILRNRQIDIIETPELHAETLLHSFFNARPPLVVRMHSGTGVVLNFEPDHSTQQRFNARLENWLIKKAAHITSPSHALLNASSTGRASQRFNVIANPVDVNRFKPAAQPRASDASPNVICVGRPRHLKGIHILAQAIPLIWEANPEVNFTFVPAPMGKGGGSPSDSYREILGNLITDRRVRIVAPVPRAELPQLYVDATLCVVPSLWEGFGYVCAEAMACGLPVVASRTGGLEEIVEEGQSGVLIEPGNVAELAQAVVSLLSDPERCARLGVSARKRIVEQFSSPVIAARMADLYQEIVQEAAN